MKTVKAWALTNCWNAEIERDLHDTPIIYKTRADAVRKRYNNGAYSDVLIVRVEIREVKAKVKR